MLNIGITGNKGFIGSWLKNTLGLQPDKYKLIDFERDFFYNREKLDQFVTQCDTIIHLAAINRHDDPNIIYNTNILLVQQLVDALNRTKSTAHILFSSSTHEERETEFGKSKKVGRKLFQEWANSSGGVFSGLIIPNVFGPFGLENYNSFIATFCYKLTHGELPEILHDSEINLIYINDLIQSIKQIIDNRNSDGHYYVHHTSIIKVSDVLNKLINFTNVYLEKGEIPNIESKFDFDLFNTYRSFIDFENHFPIKFARHSDTRGSFIELIRMGIGGQCSFSTTRPGVTRGNHFHTRKIERFSVIKGTALIQLRKINSNKILNFYLDGSEPAYVDIPIWYTHNIKNIGEDELFTVFWINETFDPEDTDTYFEVV
jgi:UDP-2-acetamido-2,6-beta-L-arabino-hexul-4-ose reductase